MRNSKKDFIEQRNVKAKTINSVFLILNHSNIFILGKIKNSLKNKNFRDCKIINILFKIFSKLFYCFTLLYSFLNLDWFFGLLKIEIEGDIKTKKLNVKEKTGKNAKTKPVPYKMDVIDTLNIISTDILQSLASEYSPADIKNFINDEMVIVITDIVNSTTQWNNNQRKMKTALMLHNTLVRYLTKKFSGYESRNEGDSFFIVFKNVWDAVHFSINLQNDLLYLNWSNEIENNNPLIFNDNNKPLYRGLSVRIGINNGECIIKKNEDKLGYYGNTVEDTYKISSKARGGDILISDSVYKTIISEKTKIDFHVIQKIRIWGYDHVCIYHKDLIERYYYSSFN